MAEAPTWRDLVPLDDLSAWMDAEGLGDGPIGNPAPLGGGSQNILLRFERNGRNYVLRRPPRHSVADGSRTMIREARILDAISGTDVPHAALIASCADESVLGAAFYLMEPIDGFNASVALPSPHRDDPAIRHRMGLALVEGLARLGRVDHEAMGLSDMRRPDFLERQVNRWQGQLDGYAGYEGWQGRKDLHALDRIALWLDDNRPATFDAGIMHGDYHLANVLYRPDGPELAAIIDWELATVGDPLIDLAWILAMWPEDGDNSFTPMVKPWAGFPTADELIARYAAGSTRDLSYFQWYRVLACYKMGIVLEGTHARACAGKASSAMGDVFHRYAIALAARAERYVAQI